MPFLDTNSHLTTKPYNFDIKCQGNSESYDQHGFFGTKFRGGQNFLITVGGFTTRESTLGLTGRSFSYIKNVASTSVQNCLELDKCFAKVHVGFTL